MAERIDEFVEMWGRHGWTAGLATALQRKLQIVGSEEPGRAETRVALEEVLPPGAGLTQDVLWHTVPASEVRAAWGLTSYP
jgi:hypothetical protein